MSKKDLIICGGCNAKIGPGNLSKLLNNLPKQQNEQLLVGFDSSDDAAVVQLSEDLALVQTLDFFPAMVSDPYLFGKIAAANALSDVYAMGGEVISALNIVCFPEQDDLAILGEILRGGAEKVAEAGAILAGGHSIHDAQAKYGLSVTGKVHPKRIWQNNAPQNGDCLVLTKALGVGIVTTGYSVGEIGEEAFTKAVASMEMLNKTAAEVAKTFTVHSCTDVTGFGLLGHLSEMLNGKLSAELNVKNIPVLPGAYDGAKEFLITAGGQRNRNHLAGKVTFTFDDFAFEELMFDPQTSGGLLFSVPEAELEAFLADLEKNAVTASFIGRITGKQAFEIIVND
ncbi:MAG: selenide, water dikinase SelD [Turicibacter sp.]|nr:selenide, water dikinase SelD [Turicibacter sp.]